MDPQNTEVNKKKRNNTSFYIIIAILLVAVAGLAIWSILTKSDLNALMMEKEIMRMELTSEIDSLLTEQDRVVMEYGELADSLIMQDSMIRVEAADLKKQMENWKWDYYKLKKKFSRLQVVSQGYVRRMDSLITANNTLQVENERIREEIKMEQRKTAQLRETAEDLEEKVEEASRLKTYKVEAFGIRTRNSKETKTDRAKKVDRIKVCFTLSENTIIESGDRTLYVRIADPDNKIMAKGRTDTYSFTYNGEQLQYSIAKDIDYINEAQDICMYYTVRSTQELAPGDYKVEIFDGDFVIGAANFSLRK